MYFENFSNSVKPLARKGEGNTEPSVYSDLLQGMGIQEGVTTRARARTLK